MAGAKKWFMKGRRHRFLRPALLLSNTRVSMAREHFFIFLQISSSFKFPFSIKHPRLNGPRTFLHISSNFNFQISSFLWAVASRWMKNVFSHLSKFLQFSISLLLSDTPMAKEHSLVFFINRFKGSANKKRFEYFLLLIYRTNDYVLFGSLCKREVSRLGLLPQKFVNISIEITR